MAKNELTFEVLRDGQVQPLPVPEAAGRANVKVRKAWSVLAEHFDIDFYATSEDRQATRRFLIVPQHEMENHVLLVMDGHTWEITHTYPFRDARRVDRWHRYMSVMQDLREKLSERAVELSEERIQSLLNVMIDVDPFEPVEAKIDARNAALRTEFLNDHPVLSSAAVHVQAGLKGRNTAQTVSAWRKQGRILGLQIQGKYGYPKFQFDADGQPLKLMKAVLDALPANFTRVAMRLLACQPERRTGGQDAGRGDSGRR